MEHLRMVAPPEVAPRVLDLLNRTQTVCNVVHLAGVSRRPPGDLILCDVAREDASVLLADLRRLGVATDGSIAVEAVDSSISRVADEAEEAAVGSPADAVVWEEVEARTSESAELSFSFVAFMVLATMLAAIGIMTDSQILIIGAMVVGPEFGPLAGFCVAVVEGRRGLARRSVAALAVGFPLAIALTLLFTLALRGAGTAPDELGEKSRPLTTFISHPNTFSVVVALLAGIAGVLSLTTAKSGALMGVLISVTTVPSAANVAVAAAYRDWTELGGAAAQLGINLASIVAAGIVTLKLQREIFERRRRRHVRDEVMRR